jgi:hypothetical protein
VALLPTTINFHENLKMALCKWKTLELLICCSYTRRGVGEWKEQGYIYIYKTLGVQYHPVHGGYG